MLSSSNLQIYSGEQVASLVDVDCIACENEALRRESEAEKIRAKAMRLLDKADQLQRDANRIAEAAQAERHRRYQELVAA